MCSAGPPTSQKLVNTITFIVLEDFYPAREVRQRRHPKLQLQNVSILLLLFIILAQGLENIVKIRIEPSIFEFLGWYDKGLPTFLSNEALINFGYNIDVNYRPLLPVERLQSDENYTDYYQRSFNVTKYLTNLHQGDGMI